MRVRERVHIAINEYLPTMWAGGPKHHKEVFDERLQELCDDRTQYLELIGCAKFMYYTGTRIGATLGFSFKTNYFDLQPEMWVIEVEDKGERKKGRLKWQKILIGFALDDFKMIMSENLINIIKPVDKPNIIL